MRQTLTLEQLEPRDAPCAFAATLPPVQAQLWQQITSTYAAVLKPAAAAFYSAPSLSTAYSAMIALQQSWDASSGALYDLIGIWDLGDPNYIVDMGIVASDMDAISAVLSDF